MFCILELRTLNFRTWEMSKAFVIDFKVIICNLTLTGTLHVIRPNTDSRLQRSKVAENNVRLKLENNSQEREGNCFWLDLNCTWSFLNCNVTPLPSFVSTFSQTRVRMASVIYCNSSSSASLMSFSSSSLVNIIANSFLLNLIMSMAELIQAANKRSSS